MIFKEMNFSLVQMNGDMRVQLEYIVTRRELQDLDPTVVSGQDPREIVRNLIVEDKVDGKNTIIDLGRYVVLRGEYWKWPDAATLIQRAKARGAVFLVEMGGDQI